MFKKTYRNNHIKKIEPPFIVLIGGSIAGLLFSFGVGIYGLVFNKISNDPFNRGIYFAVVGSFVFFLIYGLFTRNKFRKYIIVKEFEVLDDSIVYKSAKGLKFNVRFEDIVVIFNVDSTVGHSREVPWVVNGLVFYNRERNKYQEMRLLKKDMKEIVDKYLGWCKKNFRPPAPIYRGKVTPSFKGSKVAKKHIKEFEGRLKGNSAIPPPPWIKEGEK